MNTHYDPDTDAFFVRFSKEAIAESEEVSPGIMLDYDKDGRLVGFEVLKASDRMPMDAVRPPEAAE